MCVCDLSMLLRMKQSAISQQLKTLRQYRVPHGSMAKAVRQSATGRGQSEQSVARTSVESLQHRAIWFRYEQGIHYVLKECAKFIVALGHLANALAKLCESEREAIAVLGDRFEAFSHVDSHIEKKGPQR